MQARTEAFGWATCYGTAGGLSAVAWQDAVAYHRPGWAAVFAGYTIALIPVFYALQWREIRA